MSNYNLEIVSHHPEFTNKSLKKYSIDGIDTVGVYGNEKFSIVFKNNTNTKVQIKLSLDGIDILSGKLASTEITKDMWVVNGHDKLEISAWPETKEGGAALVFTNANNSVAVHTTGDLSCRGIIAAAVYSEGNVVPLNIFPRVEEHHHHHYYKDYYYPSPYTSPFWYVQDTAPIWKNDITCSNNTIELKMSGGTYSSTQAVNIEKSIQSNDLESFASIGAGDFTKQPIVTIAGLIKPTFSEILKIRYLWWSDLESKLKSDNKNSPHPTGFPADNTKSMMNLGNTPRISTHIKNSDNIKNNFSRI